jgi:hypothetical protein
MVYRYTVGIVRPESFEPHTAHETLEEAREYADRTRSHYERADGSTENVAILDDVTDTFVE